MSTLGDEIRLMRRRLAEIADELAILRAAPASQDQSLIVKTVDLGAYPTVAAKVYAVQRVDGSGVEEEGGAPSLSATGEPFYAANCGTKIPPPGTHLLADLIDGIWVINYNGEEAP